MSEHVYVDQLDRVKNEVYARGKAEGVREENERILTKAGEWAQPEHRNMSHRHEYMRQFIMYIRSTCPAKE